MAQELKIQKKLGLTRKQAVTLALLIRDEVVSNEALDEVHDDRRSAMYRLRRRLEKMGYELVTYYGGGYALSDDSRAKLVAEGYGEGAEQ